VLDLVEIAPTAKPPVCRIMDFGKYQYQEQKRAREARRHQKVIEVKEIKFRPGTDEGDYKIKLRNLIRFLEEGDKTKVTLRFRGREMAHQDIGFRLLERVRTDLEPHGVVEQFPRMEGRQLVMVLSPKKVGKVVPQSSGDKPAAAPKKAPSTAKAAVKKAKTEAPQAAVAEAEVAEVDKK